VDNNPLVADYAREACREYPEIEIVEGDVSFRWNDGVDEPFDYAISSLCLHHLSDSEVVELLKNSNRIATRGMILNDLKRSARAWAWIWALSRLERAHPIVQYDGPLSVKRAFTPTEPRNFARQADVTYLRAYTHFGYRLTLAGEKI
jgi:hypothetical protein